MKFLKKIEGIESVKLKGFEGSVLDSVKKGTVTELINKDDLAEFNDFYENEASYNSLKKLEVEAGKKGRTIENNIMKKMPNYKAFARARKSRGYIIQRVEELYGTHLINSGNFGEYTVIAYPVQYYVTLSATGEHTLNSKTDFNLERGFKLSNKEGFLTEAGDFTDLLVKAATEILKKDKDRIYILKAGQRELAYRVTVDLSEKIESKENRRKQ